MRKVLKIYQKFIVAKYSTIQTRTNIRWTSRASLSTPMTVKPNRSLAAFI